MIKTLFMDTTDVKFTDNDTNINLVAKNNGIILYDSSYDPYIYIRNDQYGYIKSFQAEWNNKNVHFISKNLNDLPTGLYQVELWLKKSQETLIYPDSGFLKLTIQKNATGIVGDLVSSITLRDFQNDFSDLSSEILNNLPEGKVGPQGEKGDTGAQGVQGIQGDTGEQGKQGQQGVQGVAGKDFSIAETFPSVASMRGDNLTKGDFVMISSTVEDPDNAKLYLWNGTGFTFVTDMSGATGIKGDTGEQGIRGKQGVQGETGRAGKDAVINVVTQAEYDKLPDKTGVYFIGG